MIGILQPKPEKFDQLKKNFSDLASNVLQFETGCLEYSVYVQKKGKDGVQNLILHERYVDQEALNHHLQTSYFLKAAAAMGQEEMLRVDLDMEEVFVVPVAGHAAIEDRL